MGIALIVEILGDASKLGSSLDDAGKKAGGFAGGMGGTLLKVGAVAGVAGVAASAIWDMADAAAADRDEQAKLETAIRAAGAATGDYALQVDAAIAAGQAKAFTDSETRDALQSLVTATGDVSEATALLGPAQDIARFAGVDLATAADAVAKAQAGQATSLTKLIPGLDKSGSATDILAAATAAAAGQADAYAESSAGMKDKAGDAFGELSEQLGSVFLPILDALLPAITPILQAFGKLVTSLLPLLIPLIKVLGTAIGIVADVLTRAVDWLSKFIDWVIKGLDWISKFVDKLNPLKDFKLPSLPFLSASPGAAPASSSAASRSASSSAGGAPIVNVYTSGDSIDAEQAVVRALRRVTRLNGGVLPAVGWSKAGG